MASDDQLFPIDIHYNKLLDWLIDRRHCELKWHSQAREIHDKIRAAVGSLPSSKQFAELTRQEDLNYFLCQKVVELLKSTEGESKNLFGQYNSLILREWSDILKLYEKKNVYLAEGAQQLMRNVNYEIPAVKQQMSKCHQTQRDCQKKEGECSASAAAFRDKFDASCKEMGIQGENVRRELARCVADLPDIFKQILTVLPNLVPVITYYQKFIHHTTGRSPGDSEFLPMLSFVLKRGNVTVYEWKYGEPPPLQKLATTQTQADELVPGSGNGELEIDWGDGDNATALPPPQLNTTATDSQTADGIDFGESGIDFGESEVEIGDDQLELADIVLEGSGEEGGVGNTQENGCEITADLQPLLGHIETRNQFLDDIQELREFLLQRDREMGDEGSSSSHLLLQQFSRGTESIGLQSQETIEEMLGHVNQVLDVLTSPRTQHLFLIQGSTTYLDRLADSLLQSKQLAGKASTQVQVYAGRREDAAALAISLEPKLTALVGQTKELQSQIAADVSKRYSNRVVNIMGEINHI